MFQAAEHAGISPLRLGFTGTLKVIRGAIAVFCGCFNRTTPFFWTWLIMEILDEKIPTRLRQK